MLLQPQPEQQLQSGLISSSCQAGCRDSRQCCGSWVAQSLSQRSLNSHMHLLPVGAMLAHQRSSGSAVSSACSESAIPLLPF